MSACLVYKNKNKRPYRIYLGKKVRDKLFKKDSNQVRLVIKGITYYATLTYSFFRECPHLDTAYMTIKNEGQNKLIEWLDTDNVDFVKISVIEKFKVFELKKSLSKQA